GLLCTVSAPDPPLTFLVVNTGRFLLTGAKRPPATSLCFGDSGSAFCCPGAGRQPAVESTAPLSRHHPHDARGSGSGFGAAPRSEFALQRQPCARQAAFEHFATPMPFSTGYFATCASGYRAADNGIHQLSLMISPVAPKLCKTP